VTVRAAFGSGPAGTGVYLLGHEGSWRDAGDVDVWMTVLFFPLVPLARWRVVAASAGEGVLELTVQSRSRIPAGAALRRIGKAAGVAALTCLPFAFGAWKVGSPWAVPALAGLLGSVVGPGLLDKLGMAMELGVVLAGAALPILVLMHLDERTPRVPLPRLGAGGRS
jgi:hypothetical protein